MDRRLKKSIDSRDGSMVVFAIVGILILSQVAYSVLSAAHTQLKTHRLQVQKVRFDELAARLSLLLQNRNACKSVVNGALIPVATASTTILPVTVKDPGVPTRVLAENTLALNADLILSKVELQDFRLNGTNLYQANLRLEAEAGNSKQPFGVKFPLYLSTKAPAGGVAEVKGCVVDGSAAVLPFSTETETIEFRAVNMTGYGSVTGSCGTTTATRAVASLPFCVLTGRRQQGGTNVNCLLTRDAVNWTFTMNGCSTTGETACQWICMESE